MAITLNGSTGITSPGGDTSTSLSTGLLTVTGSTVPANGMYLPTTNTLAWATNSTERMRLDSSGNLGIGTTSPAARIHSSGTSSAGYVGNYFDNTATNGYVRLDLRIGSSGGSGVAVIKYAPGVFMQIGPDSNDTTTPLVFATNNATERARIDSSGNLLVGTTSATIGAATRQFVVNNTGGFAAGFSNTTAGNETVLIQNLDTSGTRRFVVFKVNGGTGVGEINSNGTTTSYVTTSDQRLKENITDAPSALNSVNAIKVRSFDWKADGSHVDYGYIAQELLEVVPEAVSVPANPEEMMGVDFGRLTPRIIKALQELTARLEALEGAK